jgi:hypothetical protein
MATQTIKMTQKKNDSHKLPSKNGIRDLFRILIASSCLALSACSIDTITSNEVSSEALHQSYSLQFDENSQSTSVTAQFRVSGWSGTTVELQAPASIDMNGRALDRQNFLGTRYVGKSKGFQQSAVFQFKNKEGKAFVNAIDIEQVCIGSRSKLRE